MSGPDPSYSFAAELERFRRELAKAPTVPKETGTFDGVAQVTYVAETAPLAPSQYRQAGGS